MNTYLPLLMAALSFFTALAVAWIGFRNSRSTEADKVRYAYFNYALQKIMEEYVKYDPTIYISYENIQNSVKLIEERFKECRYSIVRVSPIINPEKLTQLRAIEIKHSDMMRSQANLILSGRDPEVVDAHAYIEMLCNYMSSGHELLRSEIEILRRKLEGEN